MELLFCTIIGIIVGVLFGRRVFQKDVVGSLRVDQSDPDSGPYLFLEIYKGNVEKIMKRKYIKLKVDIKNYTSRK